VLLLFLRAWTIGMLLAAIVLMVRNAHAEAYSADDTEAAIADVHAAYGVPIGRLHEIVSCETGRTMDPNVVGDHGTSFGAVQLHRGGALSHFFSLGYTDPFNPWQAIEYLARALIGEFLGLGIGGWSWTCS
jgi:hypothetical protein